MTTNVLRDELARYFSHARSAAGVHDRGVLLAVILSAIPVLPIPIFGLLLGLLNRRFCRAGKLPESEHTLVNRGLILAVVNIAIGAALTALVVHLFSSIPFNTIVDHARERIASVFGFFFSFARPVRPGITV